MASKESGDNESVKAQISASIDPRPVRINYHDGQNLRGPLLEKGSRTYGGDIVQAL